MVFSNLVFLWLFLPTVLAVYFVSSLRTLSRNHELQTDYFEKEVEERDRQMQELMHQVQREDRNTGENER